MSNQVLLPLDMFSKKGSTNALASSQFSDSSKEEDRSQCLSISNEVPYHNPRSNSSSSGVGSGSESGASINGESETSDYQRSKKMGFNMKFALILNRICLKMNS